MKPRLKPPGTKRSKLEYDGLLSTRAFEFKLRHFSKGVDRILQAVLGDTEIEDLWLTFFCCSTNLTRGWLSTHTSGTVWRYVRASMTVLGRAAARPLPPHE